MLSLKYLLSALAATHLVFAESDCGDTTIESQSDADDLKSCKTVDGTVTIKSSYSQGLALNGVQKVTGDIMCDSASALSSISGDSLSSIGGNFTLNNLTVLSELSFPKLTSIGQIKFDSLPALGSLSFEKGVDETSDVSITNTGLTSLDGIGLKMVGELNIQANTYLKTANLDKLINATGIINLSLNRDTVEVSLPNLTYAKGLTFRNVSSVSVPSLKNLDGELGFWGTQFETFYAPKLKTCGDMVFNDNAKLTNITIPYLETVNGGFTVARNDKLDVIDLPSLTKLTGAIDFSGRFSQLNLKSLDDVQGRFNVQSTSGDFDCETFDKLEKDKVIKGKYYCKARKENPTTSSGKAGTASDGSSSGGSGETSSGAANVNSATPIAGVAALFYALVQFV